MAIPAFTAALVLQPFPTWDSTLHGSHGLALAGRRRAGRVGVRVGQGFALTRSLVTEKGNIFMRQCPGAQLTTLSNSHLNITSQTTRLGQNRRHLKCWGHTHSPITCLPVGRPGAGSHAPRSGGRPPPLSCSQTIPQHHSRLWVSSVCLSVCLQGKSLASKRLTGLMQSS